MTSTGTDRTVEDEELMQHSIQFDAGTEALSCLCGFAPIGDGTHGLTNHLVDTATADLRSELEAARARLDSQHNQHPSVKRKRDLHGENQPVRLRPGPQPT